MKISTKGRYALRMLIDLAEHRESGFVSLKDIAKRQGISKKYLEQIIPIFNHSNILLTNRGAQGGYKLDNRDVVLCACSTKEMVTVEKAIKLVDPRAFTVILESNEVLGEGFKSFRVAEKQTD